MCAGCHACLLSKLRRPMMELRHGCAGGLQHAALPEAHMPIFCRLGTAHDLRYARIPRPALWHSRILTAALAIAHNSRKPAIVRMLLSCEQTHSQPQRHLTEAHTAENERQANALSPPSDENGCQSCASHLLIGAQVA